MENDSLTKVWIWQGLAVSRGGACGFSYDEFGFQGVLVAEFGAGRLMRFKRISAAARPISRKGWRTVVKAGFWKAAL